MRITIFTPTYNRSYILPKLYKSLISQTCKDFVWLIVDDGSTDNTSTLVRDWIEENKIIIEYYKQENQGKSIAHNKGVELTNTELFVCVDSDDYLSNFAVENILNFWSTENTSKTIGILAFRGNPKGYSITTIKNNIIKSTTLNKAYTDYGLKGDTMLVYRTDIISKYRFPKFENEKFVPEGYLYDLMDKDGDLLLLRKVLYYCEYLNDGYTKNMAELLLKNPKGYLAYIDQRLEFDNKIKDKIINTIKYSAISIAIKKQEFIKNSAYPIITIATLPLAYILYMKRYK